jgi:hypothetical protein
MTHIFLDIETIPGDKKPTVEDVKVPGNIKKQETREKWLEENAEEKIEELYHAQGLDSMSGKIFCISFAVEDEEPKTVFSSKEFGEAVSGYAMPIFVGHNSRKFDMKWIYRHAIKENAKDFAKRINFNKFRGNIEDTMEIWGCDDYREYVKLDDIAEFLGVERKSEGIDGSQVWEYVKGGRGDEVVKYCEQDVRVCRAVYKALV